MSRSAGVPRTPAPRRTATARATGAAVRRHPPPRRATAARSGREGRSADGGTRRVIMFPTLSEERCCGRPLPYGSTPGVLPARVVNSVPHGLVHDALFALPLLVATHV